MHRIEGNGSPLLPPLAAFEARAATFLADPGLRPALAGYCRAMLEPDAEAWPTAKFFNQFGRYMVGFLLIHQHEAWRAQGGPAPTLGRLQATSSLSPRQTANVVAGLRAGHLAEAEPGPDGRARILVPTAPLVAAIARSMLAFLRAADTIERPARARAPAFESSPDHQAALVHRTAEFALTHGILLDRFPRVFHFTGKDCGYLVLAAVIAAAYAPAGGPAPSLSSRSLAGRFRVSRSHIASLTAAATRAGWFETDGRGRLTAIDPGFRAEYDAWAAAQLGLHTLLAEQILG